ncbi:cold-shock protein [Nocardia bovistercoris]|uniref:Cold-shock protein n=1 Tax=Nocardia bovistercoris TaxID=2785916 RepID=A0A931IHR8_9NOCA|nr:cold-shock protein [Nocardia bovistercoris]MBH0781824.1 cold-shock protein [Nocardia bovistercoris]
MVHGTVKWFDTEKGFGFIARDGEEPDVFVDYLELEGSGFRALTAGQRVQFELRQAKAGPEAVRVRVIG